jgi:hypothetical protein
MNNKSVALFSVLLGVSLGAYFVLQTLRGSGKHDEHASGEDESDDVDDVDNVRAAQDPMSVVTKELMSDEEQHKIAVAMKTIESEFLLSITAIETTISAMEETVRKKEQSAVANDGVSGHAVEIDDMTFYRRLTSNN